MRTRAAGARWPRLARAAAWLVAWWPALSRAGSPFATGANAFQVSMLAILTPIAAIAVMATGVLGWIGKISWWWFTGVIIGTICVFGAPQIVTWIRGLAGV